MEEDGAMIPFLFCVRQARVLWLPFFFFLDRRWMDMGKRTGWVAVAWAKKSVWEGKEEPQDTHGNIRGLDSTKVQGKERKGKGQMDQEYDDLLTLNQLMYARM